MGWEKGRLEGGGGSWCFAVHRSEDRKVCVGRGGTGEREKDARGGGGGGGELERERGGGEGDTQRVERRDC